MTYSSIRLKTGLDDYMLKSNMKMKNITKGKNFIEVTSALVTLDQIRELLLKRNGS